MSPQNINYKYGLFEDIKGLSELFPRGSEADPGNINTGH